MFVDSKKIQTLPMKSRDSFECFAILATGLIHFGLRQHAREYGPTGRMTCDSTTLA